MSDPIKAEAVARQLLGRRLKQEKSVVRAALDPLPPSRPPLKPAPSVGNTSDPLKAELVARDLLARRLADNQAVLVELSPYDKQEPDRYVKLAKKWAMMRAWAEGEGETTQDSSEGLDQPNSDLQQLWASTKAWAEKDGTSFKELASSPTVTQTEKLSMDLPPSADPQREPVVESQIADTESSVNSATLVDSGKEDESSDVASSVVGVPQSIIPEATAVEAPVDSQSLNAPQAGPTIGDSISILSDQERFIGGFMMESELKTPKSFFEQGPAQRIPSQPNNQIVEPQKSDSTVMEPELKPLNIFSEQGPDQKEPSQADDDCIIEEKIEFTMLEPELKIPKIFFERPEA